jgi:hypothetical protein
LAVGQLFLLATLGLPLVTRAATFSDWQFRQTYEVSTAGLVKLSLPPDTLNAARPDFADLRLADSAGNEMPYLIERPVAPARVVRPALSFRAQLGPDSTLLTIETGLTQQAGSIILSTPANDFIKAVQISGSADGTSWQTVASGVPIFRQPNGASQLRLDFPATVGPFLRLTIDDRGSRPVPFTGASVDTVGASPVMPTEPVAVQVTGRVDSPTESRLELDLGAAHLRLVSLELESPDPLFRRQITLAARQVEDNTVRERALASGSVYRLALAGQPTSERLRLDFDALTPTRELVLQIDNGDSPPLRITNVRARRWPAYLVFYAAQPGACQIYSGNRLCAAPRYDLSSQSLNLKNALLAPTGPSALAANPAYRTPETLPQIPDAGAALDASAWRYRKPIHIERPGVQQLELDLEVLAGAQPGFADLRLVRDGRQLPFVVEHPAASQLLKAVSTSVIEALPPGLSRWSLKLPLPGLPLTRLSCTSSTPLFRREVALFEEPLDERGSKYRRDLGSESWVQSPDRSRQTFSLTLRAAPLTDTLYLETRNEDNPPIALAGFEFAWPVTRLLFKTSAAENVFLYYGNPQGDSPHYDLSLVANQLLRADKAPATLGAQESWHKPSWAERQRPGKAGWLLWVVLGVVVLVLLAVIARLMPKPSPPAS